MLKELSIYKISNHSLLTGDFNARSPIWGYDFTDTRGDSLIDFALHHNLNFLNIPELGPIFVAYSGKGNPDISLISNSIIYLVDRWEVLDLESLSDHRFVSVHLRCDLNNSEFYLEIKYGINKYLKKFKKSYPKFIQTVESIWNSDQLEEFANLLISTVRSSAFISFRIRRVLVTPVFS
ncbi:reverse transcriptase domain-containing protein [Nephila pilipes]|uniref:Reverse transcriptase domain-containing protein n=1 Tax=Nephila pilipes TaxID=299642 RepID=A0A8X6TLE5_NEPPI|nr:reverse transcriptase domain-containing protein [Nephila pilipes]